MLIYQINYFACRVFNTLKHQLFLANAFLSRRLEYINSLFLSLTDFGLRRLQLVQNSLCRVVTRSSKFSHITPQLKKLHQLPVRYRVQFKIGLITYKILNQGQPVYLRELIHPYSSSRNMRCSTPKLSSFIPPLSTVEFTNQLKTFLILSVSISLCRIFEETPQNPSLQFQFPNLVSFPLSQTHNSRSLTLNASRPSL